VRNPLQAAQLVDVVGNEEKVPWLGGGGSQRFGYRDCRGRD
jgi:hypothetical protein